jgi:hypothetical protein
MQLAPIALFVYNRPEHTRKTIEALKKNTLATQSDLVIFSDAPKSSTQNETVRQVRDYIAQIDGFKSVSVIERNSNYGLANSIIDGVTMLCNKHGNVIVLEDDLETSPFFLDYMNNALLRYADEPKVMQISGYMFDVNLNSKDKALFLPLTTSWGWATWKRAWDTFDPEARGYKVLKEDKKLRKIFNLNNRYNYYAMLESQLSGKVDSWAIRWYLTTFLMNGLTLYPPQTLVSNNGFDGSGTHGELKKRFHQNVNISAGVPILPEQVELSEEWEIVSYNMFSRKTRLNLLKHYLTNFLKFSLFNKKV